MTQSPLPLALDERGLEAARKVVALPGHNIYEAIIRAYLTAVPASQAVAVARAPSDFYVFLKEFTKPYDGDISRASFSRLSRELAKFATLVPLIAQEPAEGAAPDYAALLRDVRKHVLAAWQIWIADDADAIPAADSAVGKLIARIDAALSDSPAPAKPEGAVNAELLAALKPFAKAVEPDAETLSGWRFGITPSTADFKRAHEVYAALSAPSPRDALADLVTRFSAALLEKLRAAEQKYGYSDDWARSGWADTLRSHLREHVEKGDPRDVAAYCAFAWHHGWSVASAPSPRAPVAEPFGLKPEQIAVLRENGLKPEEISGDDKTQTSRVRELLHWFARLARNSANPKWTREHAFELAFYIATTDDRAPFDIVEIERKAYCQGLLATEADRRLAERIGLIPAAPSPREGWVTDWRDFAELPEIGSKFVALYDDGSGATLYFRHDGGYIDADGYDTEILGGIGKWTYLPAGFEFWCEGIGEPVILPKWTGPTAAPSPQGREGQS